MLYKALVSFSGSVSMVTGEIRDIPESPVTEDLLKARYIEPVKEKEKKAKNQPKEKDDE